HGSFIYTLKEFLNNTFAPPATRMTSTQLGRATLPFSRLDVYHNFKFEPSALDPGADEDEENTEIFQTVISQPCSADRTSPPRFDTVIVRTYPDAEATGLSG
ncbi:hypothetical protein DFH07DRAFT_693478, partial [Mycena maculata]